MGDTQKAMFRVGAETGRLYRKPIYGQTFRYSVLKYTALTRYSEIAHVEGSGRIREHGFPVPSGLHLFSARST